MSFRQLFHWGTLFLVLLGFSACGRASLPSFSENHPANPEAPSAPAVEAPTVLRDPVPIDPVLLTPPGESSAAPEGGPMRMEGHSMEGHSMEGVGEMGAPEGAPHPTPEAESEDASPSHHHH
ncbi:MAG: hypothetical protein KatS3mg115_0428 [Candidatus Poribacteria bacterium]|nr:MAG: hypothetical protein KatS3mg115_0428 [Candidatus Poribacteria bacterium]